jgi:HD-like signal output (HDOD) protein
MNERIQQLAEQALNEYSATYLNEAKIPEAYLKKFAELIVQECALTAGLMEQANRSNIGAGILDRFGVEL